MRFPQPAPKSIYFYLKLFIIDLMNKVEELQKRVEHLETEVELLKELIKLQNKCQERTIPTYSPMPIGPYFSKEPHLEPPYKITCKGEE